MGQNDWVQFSAQSTLPIQVSGGSVVWTGGVLTNDQDAILPFGSLVSAPAVGTTTLYVGVQLSVASAGASPSYFAALNTLNATVTSGNFPNARLVAQGGVDSFAFGVRVTGQAGYPFVYGPAGGLTYGTTYNLVARVSMVAGVQNDVIDLFVAPADSALSFDMVYASSVYTSGAATDPASYGAFVLSQFGSANAFQSGVDINKIIVTPNLADVTAFAAPIPEPSAFATLAGAAALVGVLGARRRRSAA